MLFADAAHAKVADPDLDVEVGVVCVCELGGAEGDNIDVGDPRGGAHAAGQGEGVEDEDGDDEEVGDVTDESGALG